MNRCRGTSVSRAAELRYGTVQLTAKITITKTWRVCSQKTRMLSIHHPRDKKVGWRERETKTCLIIVPEDPQGPFMNHLSAFLQLRRILHHGNNISLIARGGRLLVLNALSLSLSHLLAPSFWPPDCFIP